MERSQKSFTYNFCSSYIQAINAHQSSLTAEASAYQYAIYICNAYTKIPEEIANSISVTIDRQFNVLVERKQRGSKKDRERRSTFSREIRSSCGQTSE